MLQHIRSIAASVIVLAVAAPAGFGPTPSQAAEGTIYMRVVNVAPNDVLNIREHPTSKSRIMGLIPPNASGVEYLGQEVGNWLLVYFNNAEGWVRNRYVIAEVAGWTSEAEEIPETYWNRRGQARQGYQVEPEGKVGSFLCVLGSWRIEDNAVTAFEVAKQRMPYELDISRLKLSRDYVEGTTGVWYRVVIDEFYDRSSAQSVCKDFKSKPFSSFVQVNK